MIEAERAFAAEGARSGWIDAYPVWAAKDGIVLQGGLTNAHDFAANIHPDVRGDTSLAWGPEFAGISKAGDFGFTAGPFNGDGAAFGYYLTVWRKQADGAWRWLFEGGIDVAGPTTVPAADAAVASVALEGGSGSATSAAAAVADIEKALASAAQTDAAAALVDHLAPDAHVYREMFAPAANATSAATLLSQGPTSINFSALRSEASSAGDMVFTLGEARWGAGKGHYTRVWAHQADGWRIVFDQIIPD